MHQSLQIIILGAGYATGFRPLSLLQPKILAPVCNISLLNRILYDLQKDGFEEATLVIRHSWESTMKSVELQIPKGFRLTTSFIPTAFQGSVNCVRAAVQPGKSSLLVIYGDSLVSTDFHQLVESHMHLKTLGAKATILYHYPTDIRLADRNGRTYHGVIGLENDQRIHRFLEKPLVSEIHPGFEAANAAVFVCESEILEDSRFRSAADFSFDLFVPLSAQIPSPLFGANIGSGFRLDLGNIQRFFDINMLALKRKLPIRMPGFEIFPGIWAHESGAIARLIPPCVIGHNVRIVSDATIGPNAIVGDDVQVGKGSLVRDSIILNGVKLGNNVKIHKSIIGDFTAIHDGIELPTHSVCGPYSKIGNAFFG